MPTDSPVASGAWTNSIPLLAHSSPFPILCKGRSPPRPRSPQAPFPPPLRRTGWRSLPKV
jgi:hypothetical protein